MLRSRLFRGAVFSSLRNEGIFALGVVSVSLCGGRMFVADSGGTGCHSPIFFAVPRDPRGCNAFLCRIERIFSSIACHHSMLFFCVALGFVFIPYDSFRYPGSFIKFGKFGTNRRFCLTVASEFVIIRRTQLRRDHFGYLFQF